MRIILIGNYPQDKQESMIRFAQMLSSGFTEAGYETTIWNPVSVFGKIFHSTTTGTGKWMGYIDKWVIFPFLLKLRLLGRRRGGDRYHICDHSNAPYLQYLPKASTSITCHDVLAIRGAFGHEDAFCPASRTGKIFQQWILNNLKRAERLAAVSQKTLDQLHELAGGEGKGKNWKVIYNAFNNDFRPLNKTYAASLLANQPLKPDLPFLLHVGSGLPRKNRALLINMMAALAKDWDGFVCVAGDAIEDSLIAHALSQGVGDRIVSIVKPDHKILQALYSSCVAFIFPSFSEGFGWPVIEAQACGAPVIASNNEPMPEISGGAALHINPSDASGFANAFLSLRDDKYRNALIARGYNNCLRFEPQKMIDNYLNLHGLQRIKL